MAGLTKGQAKILEKLENELYKMGTRMEAMQKTLHRLKVSDAVVELKEAVNSMEEARQTISYAIDDSGY